MRKPVIKNKYNLEIADVNKAIVIKPDALKEEPFWRNDQLNCYTVSQVIGNAEFGDEHEFYIQFYDDGHVELKIYCFSGMSKYTPKHFYDQNEIECDQDLRIQELLLAQLNWLLDNKVIKIPGKEVTNEAETV